MDGFCVDRADPSAAETAFLVKGNGRPKGRPLRTNEFWQLFLDLQLGLLPAGIGTAGKWMVSA
jgi:hypothetical protein